MKIIEALRIEKGNAIAIVGAGGKTSLLFALAGALSKPVWLTTTTKLMFEEGHLASEHVLFPDFESSIAKNIDSTKTILITNPQNSTAKKWLGLSPDEVDHLIPGCRQKGVTCLIEADGARHLSLKAPAEWEPVIPDQVDLVIVVVGLSVISKHLTEEFVFRPELFTTLTGLSHGDPIQLEHVLRMLNHPDGGLKGIPPNSRAAVVFNQSDAYSLKSHELHLVQSTLQKHFSIAILTSLQTDSQNCEVIMVGRRSLGQN